MIGEDGWMEVTKKRAKQFASPVLLTFPFHSNSQCYFYSYVIMRDTTQEAVAAAAAARWWPLFKSHASMASSDSLLLLCECSAFPFAK